MITVKTFRSLALDIRAAVPFLPVIFLISAVCLGGVLVLHWLKGIPIGMLTRDPAALRDFPFYTGILSNTGIVLWSATAGICFFSARAASSRITSTSSRFLYASGLLTIILMCDDLFLIHEVIIPKLFGMSQYLVYGGYAGLALLYLTHFRRTILDSKYLVLVLAMMFFGLSVTLDFFQYPKSTKQSFFEDGAKFIGIVSWLLYFTDVSRSALQTSESQAINDSQPSAQLSTSG